MGQREDEADNAWTEHGDNPQMLDDLASVIANAARANHGRQEQPWKFFDDREKASARFFAGHILAAGYRRQTADPRPDPLEALREAREEVRTARAKVQILSIKDNYAAKADALEYLDQALAKMGEAG